MQANDTSDAKCDKDTIRLVVVVRAEHNCLKTKVFFRGIINLKQKLETYLYKLGSL